MEVVKKEEELVYSEKQLQEFHQVFNLYDRERTGSIPAKDIGIVLRSLGLTPTEAYVQEVVEDYESNYGGRISFDGEFFYFFQGGM